jgi:hypothetical protein
MIRVERAIRIAAPAALAWEILGDFAARHLAAGICKAITVAGEGVGAVRTMVLEDRYGGGYVQERLEGFDAKDRSMIYRIIDSGPVPFADYTGTVRVTPAGPDACVAVMTSAFVPVEIDEESARQMSVWNIETALENARRAVLHHLQVTREEAGV